ncbi:MAG TPA: acyl carrier protein [Burkholderiales bacterium]|nr:acyl carrier protein [Burkholderiales bacterium]
MSDAIKQSVKDYILETFLPGESPNELTHDLPLISGGILDSIATLKLIMHLEETFGITLEAHEADREHLDTIDQIAALVAAKKK